MRRTFIPEIKDRFFFFMSEKRTVTSIFISYPTLLLSFINCNTIYVFTNGQFKQDYHHIFLSRSTSW